MEGTKILYGVGETAGILTRRDSIRLVNGASPLVLV